MTPMSELLGRESALVKEFIGVLKAEQDALKQGNVAGLDGIAAKKSSLTSQLNSLDQERCRLLRAAGLSNDKKGIRGWLARNPSDRGMVNEWAKLIRLASEARDINNLNGQLISIHMQATEQALSALTWQPQRSVLYGRDGHSASGPTKRIIDAA